MSSAINLREIVADHLSVEAAIVTANASFRDDLGADSLDVVELVMEAEDEFNVDITDDEADKAINDGTFGDLVALVDKKLAEKAGGKAA